jgi:hypothetical protein
MAEGVLSFEAVCLKYREDMQKKRPHDVLFCYYNLVSIYDDKLAVFVTSPPQK